MSSSVLAGSVFVGRVFVMDCLTVLIVMMKPTVTSAREINLLVAEDFACHGPRDVMDGRTARIVVTRRHALATTESSPAPKVLASLRCTSVMDDLTVLIVLMSRGVLVMLINSSVVVGPAWRKGVGVTVAMIVVICLMKKVVAVLLASLPVVMDPVSTSLKNVTES